MPRLAARSGGRLRALAQPLARPPIAIKGYRAATSAARLSWPVLLPFFQHKFAGPTPLEILTHDAAQARVLAVEIAIFVTCLASLPDAEIRDGGVLYALFPCDEPDPLFAHTSSFMPGSGGAADLRAGMSVEYATAAISGWGAGWFGPNLTLRLRSKFPLSPPSRNPTGYQKAREYRHHHLRDPSRIPDGDKEHRCQDNQLYCPLCQPKPG